MKNIEESNKLIAEFMGGTIEKLVKSSDTLFFIKDKVCMGQPQWHIRYDWLMPVVEKINLLDDYKYTVYIASMDTRIDDNFNGITIVDISCKHAVDELIDSVYTAVVEFIEWYNKNK